MDQGCRRSPHQPDARYPHALASSRRSLGSASTATAAPSDARAYPAASARQGRVAAQTMPMISGFQHWRKTRDGGMANMAGSAAGAYSATRCPWPCRRGKSPESRRSGPGAAARRRPRCGRCPPRYLAIGVCSSQFLRSGVAVDDGQADLLCPPVSSFPPAGSDGPGSPAWPHYVDGPRPNRLPTPTQQEEGQDRFHGRLRLMRS